LDLDEALAFHRPAYGGVDLRADPQVALHALAPQVEVAVLETDPLVDLVGPLVDRERRRERLAEDLDLALPDLDLAGGEVLVDRALRARADDAGDPDDVLGTHVDVAVDHALDDAGVVAQVDERQVVAVLAAAGDPPGEGATLADVLGAQHAALVGPHGGGVISHRWRPGGRW